MRIPLVVALSVTLAATAAAIAPDVLQPVNAVPAHFAGRFREPVGFQQAPSGQYFVFDRRAHTVYGLDRELTSVWQIVEIGNEPGRIIDPTAFAVGPHGSFVVADAPGNRERIQVFTPAGFRTSGFYLPGRSRPRVVFDDVVLNGIGSLQYTGRSILVCQPDTGSLVTEYSLDGAVLRAFGELRQTGHEDDPQVHLALNSGFPLVDPAGGFYFVFQAGEPVFRKYDAGGRLQLERRIQGLEIDQLVARLPTTWSHRRTENGELPAIMATVRAATVDGHGNLWVSFANPYTYVFDRDGDKVRDVQFRAAGVVSPRSLSFGADGQLLVSPGLEIFQP
jgi:hypothetical protein